MSLSEGTYVEVNAAHATIPKEESFALILIEVELLFNSIYTIFGTSTTKVVGDIVG